MAKGKSSLEPDNSFPSLKAVDSSAPEDRLPIDLFVTDTHDLKSDGGHAKHVYMPDVGLAMKAYALIHDGRFPWYKSWQDLLRDALVHRVHDLFKAFPEAFDPDIEELLAHERAMAAHGALQSVAKRRTEFNKMLDDVAGMVGEVLPIDIRKQLAIISAQVGKLPAYRQGELRDKIERIGRKLNKQDDDALDNPSRSS